MRGDFALGTIMMAATLLSSGVVYASPQAGIYAQHSKAKTVNFSLRNDSKTEMKVKVGENVIILQPGKAVPVKLLVGEKVIAVDASPNFPAGTVLAVAGSQLSDATIVFQ